jgi:hypothetical protein
MKNYILINKFHIFIMGWLVSFLMFTDFLRMISLENKILAVTQAVAVVFWIWWPLRLVDNGKKKLKELNE